MRWLSDETVRHLKRVAEWPDLGETKYRPLDELGRGGMRRTPSSAVRWR